MERLGLEGRFRQFRMLLLVGMIGDLGRQDGLQIQSELLCNYNPEAASCQDTASGFSYDGSRFCFLFKNQYNTNEFKVLIIQKKELAAAVDFG